MKKNLKFLLLAPFLMAILCKSDDDVCGLSDPEDYVINVENIAETYAISETIWLNSEISSELINTCNGMNEKEIVLEAQKFRDALFLLKLNNNLSNLNAEVSQDFEVIYDVGDPFNGDYCLDAFEFLPKLTDDNLTYKYRLGLSINSPGDYCIVSANSLRFLNIEQENNDQLFEAYNTLNNTIKFASCENIFTRNGTQDSYFFTVE